MGEGREPKGELEALLEASPSPLPCILYMKHFGLNSLPTYHDMQVPWLLQGTSGTPGALMMPSALVAEIE